MTLARGLRAEDADDIATALGRQGIAANKLEEDSGKHYRIEIGANSVEAAVAAMNARAASWPKTDDIDEDAPLVPTKSDQRLRVGRALGRELARSIELLPGVLRARVHVSLADTAASLADPVAPKIGDASASVLLLLRAQLPAQISDQVRRLVAGAVPGLPAASIAIVESVRRETTTPCAPLVRVGPVSVSAASVDTLKGWLFGGLCLHMLLALAVLLLLRRGRAGVVDPDAE
ncbi:MAG TPA: hypothetical protein VHZ95_11030 [Polyangiales bacterium]|nr:hypothetical protein [Polyangiales bacterium]